MDNLQPSPERMFTRAELVAALRAHERAMRATFLEYLERPAPQPVPGRRHLSVVR